MSDAFWVASDRPTIYQALVEAHLARSHQNVKDAAGQLAQHHQREQEHVAQLMQTIVEQSYAEGLRDGFAQGVAAEAANHQGSADGEVPA